MAKITATAFAVAMIAAPLAGAPTASAWAQSPAAPENRQLPDTSQTTQAPEIPSNQNATAGQTRPLFSIGHLPVTVWAPVQPAYDSHANHTAAANQVWNGENAF